MTKRIIAVSELSARLNAVLEDVAEGAVYEVTRRGEPIAVLSPAVPARRADETAGTVARETSAEYQVSAQITAPSTALARLVGTPAMRAVLSLFLVNPGLSLHQREIARRAGVGLRSAQIALSRLASLGLLASSRDGNRLYYRAVRSERFDELRVLLSRELGIAEVLARHLTALAERAFVFGSAASGEDSVTSDIDLCVISEHPHDYFVEPIAAAQRELGREIDLVTYTPADFAARRAEGNHFVTAILEQPRFDVIGGTDGA
jgi:prevent-host-death family protein